MDLRTLTSLLSLQGADAQELRNEAYALKVANIGKVVHLRGIIELSNICTKNCFYCGIRRENYQTHRYCLTQDEVLLAAQFAIDARYGSIVLQAGERSDEKWVDWITQLLIEIKALSQGKLGITLSLGEQSYATYQRWFNAGAHRALIRIETSDENKYYTLHPQDALHHFQTRLQSLKTLRQIGYQVGSGVLIATPNQTSEDLAKELLFLKSLDVDMIGMGPFIPHQQTPLAHVDFSAQMALEKGLNMIAAARLLMPNINIASTTALQSLAKNGRELGLLAGANIIMPNMTPQIYREKYQLYDGKVALDENAESSRVALTHSIESIGETIAFDQWGDSKHFAERNVIH